MFINDSHSLLTPMATREIRQEKQTDKVREVAGEFAALFYRRLLEKAVPSSGTGNAHGFWWEIFSGEIAREITKSSPLTEYFYLQLKKESGE